MILPLKKLLLSLLLKDLVKRKFSVKEELLVAEYYYPLANEINPLLYDFIVKSKPNSKKPVNIKAKQPGWHLQGKEIEQLLNWICDMFISDFCDSQFQKTSSWTCAEMWGVLYGEGDKITRHQHEPSLYSFTYFVNTPKGSSPLVFTTSKKKIKAESGKLIIFSSRIKHHVPPNRCKDRCSIAGNFINLSKEGTYGI